MHIKRLFHITDKSDKSDSFGKGGNIDKSDTFDKCPIPRNKYRSSTDQFDTGPCLTG